MEFVERAPQLLGSLLSRESLPDACARCPQCDGNKWAVWRCQDCSLGETLCRACIRQGHKSNPFHKIQRWTGRFFRAAELWEVGSYILVPHRVGDRRCESLQFKNMYLESVQSEEDLAEQQTLERLKARGEQPSPGVPAMADEDDGQANVQDGAEEAAANAAIDAYIQQLHEEITNGEIDNGENADMEDDVLNLADLDEDIHASAMPRPGDLHGPKHIPAYDALQHPYVRVVHTNGVHHLAMVSCSCRNDGPDDLALDLMTSRLVPASFLRIRTLFTAQVLDHFRLCNLELKASAYQFYQLLRRITSPYAPGQVINLYNELRRMSRLWRWMKRLKWNGFGHNGRSFNDIQPGELAIFCAACPQPGINIPSNWQTEPDKYLYRRVFVTDGNFKADHVRQPKSKGDYWLAEGGGMDPRYSAYEQFLKTAIEKPTVRWPSICAAIG